MHLGWAGAGWMVDGVLSVSMLDGYLSQCGKRETVTHIQEHTDIYKRNDSPPEKKNAII